MESAENREQSQQSHPQLAASNSSSLSTTETFQLLYDSFNRLESLIKRISKNSDADLPFSTSIQILKHNFSLVVIEVTAIALRAPAKLIALVVATVFWLWLPQRQVSFFSMPEAVATEIMSNEDITPNPEPTETLTINSDKSINANTVTEEQPVEIELTNPELETADETAIPQDLVSPGKSEKLNLETIEPKLIFTPEQTLISALRTKIVKLTKDYDDKFVDSIKVDLPNNSLSVEVKDSWYELKDSVQNKLANDILQRSRKLHFDKLEFKDSQGTLVARNPVVGNQIIILQSQKSNEKLATDD